MYDIGDLYNAALGVAVDGSSNIYVCGSSVANDGLTPRSLWLALAPDGSVTHSAYL